MAGNSISKRLGTGVLLMSIMGFYAAILCSRITSRNSRHNARAEATHAPTLYKTICSHDDSSSLIGFELHSVAVRLGGELHKQCSVIVRDMDPASDDYKTYCKDIVDDLVAMYGAENLTVNIYDSFEAYSLVMDESRLLTNKDAEFIASHKVASFEAYYEDGDRLAFLTYYPDADNRYSERVGYTGGGM